MDWSPDGKWLAFGSGFEVWIVGANGENPRQLTQIRQHFQGLTWSPDSELIAFPFDGGSPRLDIYAMSPLGGPTQRIAETRDLNETHPSWSPDGRHIAVSGQKGGGHGISILNVESGEVQTLVETPEWAQSLDWCDPTRRLSVTSAAKQPEAWGRLKQWIATGSQ
ncbi:MAG: hypothetical protein O3A46_15300 [Candidatus Poribacteria bacterium]|nr:hypothetical protein [Candidatus Poribacteria bacterium]